MNNHQSLKAEIDTREDNFTASISLGKELLMRNHYASNEIKEKLLLLNNQRNSLLSRWEERWENLQLILEVYQFARDAAVAEAWLMAQEPYLMSTEFGQTIDEVENLIKKHEAFEKSASAQEERFCALERHTTFELLEFKRRKEEEERERQRQEELAKQSTLPLSSSGDRVDGDGSGEARTNGDHDAKSPVSPGPLLPLEATVMRKHEWESTTKKASSRSWEKMYIKLNGSTICCYKDQKTAKNHPDSYYKGEQPIELRGGSVEKASDYTKKTNVFRVKTQGGAEYLFQPKEDDQPDIQQWIASIAAIIEEGAVAGPSKSQTLPAAPTDRKDEPKRRSFFTLKKS